MTLEAIQRLVKARPFQPFELYLDDGRATRLDHPEFFAHTPGGRTIMIGLPDESFEIIDLLLVTSIKPVNGSSANPAGGAEPKTSR
jgi:hypothetical protein